MCREPLLSLNRELRKEDPNRIAGSKGVKQRRHGHRKWCASEVSQTLLSREKAPHCPAQGKHSMKIFLSDF